MLRPLWHRCSPVTGFNSRPQGRFPRGDGVTQVIVAQFPPNSVSGRGGGGGGGGVHPPDRGCTCASGTSSWPLGFEFCIIFTKSTKSAFDFFSPFTNVNSVGTGCYRLDMDVQPFLTARDPSRGLSVGKPPCPHF